MWGRWFSKGYINTFGALGVLGIVKEVISNVLTKPHKAGSMENTIMFGRDLDKVTLGQMTQKEIERNIKSGKYRNYSPLPDYDLWIRRIEKYMELFPTSFNLSYCKNHVEYVKYHKLNKTRLDESILTKYKNMDKYL